MMVIVEDGSTNLDPSVREIKSKILILLEQTFHQAWATQGKIDQCVIISPSIGSKGNHLWTASSQSFGLISKGYDTIGL